MVKVNITWTWAVRLTLSGLFLGILLLNIKVLSKQSQSDDMDSIVNDQLLFSLKAERKRTIQDAMTSVDDGVLVNEGDTNVEVSKLSSISSETAKLKNDVVELEPPLSKPRNCRYAHCKEYLMKSELVAIDKCKTDTSKRTVNGKLESLRGSTLNENDCNFMNGSHRLPVALASTSGCGNTWIRGLLEKATGICTGFLYCDYAMRREGFIGETVKSGSALVVKTHTMTPRWYGTKQRTVDDPYYGAAIYILRNPYNSMIAEWNRRVTYDILQLTHNESHTNVVQEKYWRIPEWDQFLRTYSEKWKSRLTNWVLNSNKQAVHVVRYEDLKADVPGEVAKMLTFLNIPFNREHLPLRLKDDFTAFKRNHSNDKFEHYSSSQTEYIRTMLMDTMKLAEKANMTDILRIEEYLL